MEIAVRSAAAAFEPLIKATDVTAAAAAVGLRFDFYVARRVRG